MNIITGMHRSGTSLIAQILNNMGADFGPRENFISPDRWNPRGYYENHQIIEINNRCILGPWSLVDNERDSSIDIKNVLRKKLSKLQYFFLPSDSKILERARKVSGEISTISDTFSDVYTKDARFLLTINAWYRFGKVNRVIFCIRHPYEISKSLNKREGIPISLAYKQWFTHVYRFLSHIKTSELFFVDYNMLLNKETSKNEMRNIYKFINLPFDEDKAEKIANETIDFSMRHSVGKDAYVPKNILNFYKKLRKLHSKQNK